MVDIDYNQQHTASIKNIVLGKKLIDKVLLEMKILIVVRCTK
jgi:hypothetical protein